MSTESIDRTTRVGTVDQAPSRTAPSPFFLAAIGMTVVLVAIGAVVAFLS